MRLAVDASSAVTGGGVTYLRELLPRLAALPGVTLGPVLVREHLPRKIDFLRTSGTALVVGNRWSGRHRTWHEALKHHGADVVFAPTEVSLARYQQPLVVMIRNACLLPSNTREYGMAMRARFALQRNLARRTARQASTVIAVSNYAACVAERALGLRRDTLPVVYHGGPQSPASVKIGGVSRFLVVSSLYRYKNLHRLLRALADVDGEWVLEVAGGFIETDYVRTLQSMCLTLNIADRVDFRGHLAGKVLSEAYQRADCLIWPSYAETFGHPLLEAHAHGLRIVAARAAANPEIAGQSAQYFDPFDISDMTQRLQDALVGRLLSGRLPRTYSWDRCAQQTADVLAEAAEG